MFAALEQNLIQRKVAATRAVREANIARRKEVLTGASEFPNLHEAHVAVLDAKPVVLAPYGEAKIKFDALPPMRLAAPFERLRDRSDRILKESGARPRVFLANLGTPADFTARATFAKSFFETGGIEAVDYRRDSADPAGSSADAPSRPPARRWPACARPTRSMPRRRRRRQQALQAAGARHIYLAGRPGRTGSRAPRRRRQSISSLPAAMRWRRCRRPIG